MTATRIFRILGLIFLGVGVVSWSIGAVFVVQRALFVRSARRVEGVVMREADDSGRPMVAVRIEGEERVVHGSVSVDPPQLVQGEHVGVFYVPGHTHDAVIDSFVQLWFGSLISLGIGTPFGMLGASFTAVAVFSARRERALRAAGTRLTGRVVALDTSMLRINRRPARRLVVEAQLADGTPQRFHSQAMLAEASEWMGREVQVFVDPSDRARYFVDVG